MKDDELIRQMTAAQNPLYTFILTLLPRPHEAEEVLQNTQVEIWKKRRRSMPPPGPRFRAWACRIAYFKVLEHRRAVARDRLIFDDELLSTLAVRAETFDGGRAARIQALHDCLGDLPARHRDLIRQRYAPHSTLTKMAEYHGKPPASLAVTLSRIRRILLACVERKSREVQG